MAISKRRIEVREGVFNVLSQKKDYLEDWDDYLMRLANGQSVGGKK